MSPVLKYSNWLVTAILLFVGTRALSVILRGVLTSDSSWRERAVASLVQATVAVLFILAAVGTVRWKAWGRSLGTSKNSQAQITKRMDDLARRFPEDTVVQFNYLPTVNAILQINTGNPAKAIEILEAARPYELGTPSNISMSLSMYPVYVRGLAYLSAKQATQAVAEFQKILTHRGIVQTEPIGSVAQLGLARAYALKGDAVKAKAAYQDFLTLWKDADPDIPILIAAKAEYAKLQ